MMNPKTNSTSTPLEDDAQLATRKKAMRRLTIAVVSIIGVMALLTFASRFQSSQKTTSEVTPLSSMNASLTPPAATTNQPATPEVKPENTVIAPNAPDNVVPPVLPANTPPGLMPKKDNTSATTPEVKVTENSASNTTTTGGGAKATGSSATPNVESKPSTPLSPATVEVELPKAPTLTKEHHEGSSTKETKTVTTKSEIPQSSPPKVSEKNQADEIENQKIQVQATSKGYAVQLGMFNSTGNAEKLNQKLNQSGIKAHIESRVYIGPFKTKADADAAIKKAKELGVDAVVLPAH